MSKARKPPRTLMFVGHHDKPITDELVWELMHRYRPGRINYVTKLPVTDEEEKAEFERWKDHPLGFVGLWFNYPHPKPPDPNPYLAREEIDLAVLLRSSGRFDLDNFKPAYVPLFDRENWNWFQVVAGGTRIDYDDAYDAAWYLDMARLTLPVFEPDFAFADTRYSVARNIGDDPRRRVWPILLYGSKMVQELGGRDHLLRAPAWRVEELPSGVVWIQVAENPFVATPGQLRRLAAHLGLEA